MFHCESTLLFAAIALSAVSARAQLLYLDSFERAPYVAGQSIDGVDNWITFASPGACTVLHAFSTARFGRSALTCWGGDPALQSSGGLWDGAWAQPVTVNPAYGTNVLVHVQCDVRLDGPDAGTGPADDLVSANLIARNGVGGSAYMWMSATGDVYCSADVNGVSQWYALSAPIQLGHYATLGMTLDYTTHTVMFSVDYVPIGALPFGGQPGEGFHGAILEFAAYDDPSYVDPSLYRACWDNLVMFAVPFGC